MSETQDPIGDQWLRAVEQLVLPVLESRIRVLGFTSPQAGAGVSRLSHAAAHMLARSGAKVLLLDLSGVATTDSSARAWIPGEKGAAACVSRHDSGYDVLTAVVTPDTRFLFNNGKRLRRTLFEDLAEYGALVVDLPPLLDDRPGSINPLAAAMGCDQVMLVCANGRTSRSDARAAADAARGAGIKLAGVVWNNCGAPPLGRDIARSFNRWLGVIPGVAGLIDRRIGRSGFLNG